VSSLHAHGLFTWTGFNAQRSGWSERAVQKFGADVERVNEVRQQVVDVAHVWVLGDVEVVAGRDRRLGDARLVLSVLSTAVFHLRPSIGGGYGQNYWESTPSALLHLYVKG